MTRISSPGQTVYNQPFYWLRVTSFVVGATYQVGGEQVITADCRAGYEYLKRTPPKSLVLSGTITVELGDTSNEPYPGPVYG